MSKEYFLIKTSYCNYYAEVWHQYPTIDKVYFGGRKKCVTYSIYLDEDFTPNLDGLGYDENCNTTSDLIRSRGTQHMLLTSIVFLQHKYHDKISMSIQFKDTSVITCDDGYEMKLSHYYMLYHQKTWYQKQFKATPLLGHWQDKLLNDVKSLKANLFSKPDGDSLFGNVRNKQKRKHLESVYSSCGSVKELLTKLKEIDCLALRGWGEDFVTRVMPYLNTIDWVIDLASQIKPHVSEIVSLGNIKPKDMFIHSGGTLSSINFNGL